MASPIDAVVQMAARAVDVPVEMGASVVRSGTTAWVSVYRSGGSQDRGVLPFGVRVTLVTVACWAEDYTVAAQLSERIMVAVTTPQIPDGGFGLWRVDVGDQIDEVAGADAVQPGALQGITTVYRITWTG